MTPARRTLLDGSGRCVRTVLLATLGTCMASPAVAGPDRPPRASAESAFHRGGMHGSLLVGYGHGFRAGRRSNRRRSRELGKVRIAEAIPRLAVGLTDPLWNDAWYRGNLEWLLEGAFLYNDEPQSGFAAGGGTSLRYNFLARSRIVPFVDANFGLIALDFDLPGQSDGFNLNVGFGAGAHWFLDARTSIVTEVRWQHISNAETNQPNFGINNALFLIGFSRFFH